MWLIRVGDSIGVMKGSESLEGNQKMSTDFDLVTLEDD